MVHIIPKQNLWTIFILPITKVMLINVFASIVPHIGIPPLTLLKKRIFSGIVFMSSGGIDP